MKYLIIILTVLTIQCAAQSKDTVSNNDITCLGISVNPTIVGLEFKDRESCIDFIRGLVMSKIPNVEAYNSLVLNYRSVTKNRCAKNVDVRLQVQSLNEDYTFEEFRKILFP